MSKRAIKVLMMSILECLEMLNALLVEKNKYKDKRRREICNSVEFSKAEINRVEEFYKENYGKKIPLTWHKSYTAYTGKFDEKYMPELLYIPKFERYMNYNKGLASALEDKNLLYIFAENSHVRMPKRIISCQEGIYKNSNDEVIDFVHAVEHISNIGECFAKPSIDSDSGRGCKVFSFENGVEKKSGEPAIDIVKALGKNFVIQERLICHDSLQRIYPKSVNTFRIISYRWHDEVVVAPIIMRIGQGDSYLDNAHAGGMFIAVSKEGILSKYAFTEFKDKYEIHPDTKLRFEGYKIDLVPEVIETVKRMHYSLPTIGVINWDMTLDENGIPTLIEANVNNGSIWLVQMAHGCGVFENRTAEILKWIKKMDSYSYAERQQHHFGD